MKHFTIKDIVYLSTIVLLVAALVTVSILYGIFRSKKAKEEQLSYYDQKCAAFALENANYTKGQIIFIGDSITDGYHLNAHYNDLPLAVYNRGIGGDRTSGVYRRLKVSLYDLAPTKVVLMIGINDINLGLTNDEIMINYAGIISEIKANLPAAQIICESVLPMNKIVEAYGVNLKKATAQIKDLNGRIKTLAEQNGCLFVDLFPHFADENDELIASYSNDGLHPNENGYAVWTSVLRPLL